MSVEALLKTRSAALLPKDCERAAIHSSLNLLAQKLDYHCDPWIESHSCFGSFRRDTDLSRSLYRTIDVDYLIVFEDQRQSPQVYMERIRRMVTTQFRKGDILKLSPYVTVQLQQIRFDLVPAIRDSLGEYCIPSPASDFQLWIRSSPCSFDLNLLQQHQRLHYQLKPAIRLLKLWNFLAGNVFPPFELEEQILMQPLEKGLSLKEVVFDAFLKLQLPFQSESWKNHALDRAKRLVRSAVILEEDHRPTVAEAELRVLFP
ncbi:MAG TPA: hypothetical protein VNQ76_16425 [Planctomicrobium sp.]|nr:hypothetical protein [Planctomicrobium sp.]